MKTIVARRVHHKPKSILFRAMCAESALNPFVGGGGAWGVSPELVFSLSLILTFHLNGNDQFLQIGDFKRLKTLKGRISGEMSSGCKLENLAISV